ncbi:MAG: DUF502 domain-containing protein, partial [Candidatus Margulisiibacteriota bacterium]
MLNKLGSYFLRGLITLLPLFVTIWLLWFMFLFLDGILGSIISTFTGRSIPGLGFIAIILLIFLAGYLATNIIGHSLMKYGDEIISRLPLVKN